MIKDITLGQYFPGNSFIHKTDARMKIIISMVFLVSVFFCKTDAAFIAMLVVTGALILFSGISMKTILKSLKPLLFVICFTSVISIFWTKGEGDPLISWKFINIYLEGVRQAVFMVLRLVCIVSGSFVILTYTTSPMDLTDAIERLLMPLKYLKVPVHDFAMMMTIALRFITPLVEETDRIICAQKARGADFETGKLTDRVKALVPILIPLFVSAFKRAEELAKAMECRCYTGGEGRTRMKQLKFKLGDFVFFAAFVAVCILALMANKISFVL
jgi:energy-coupling factor transport system permease protein